MSKARQLADLGNVYDDGALSNRNLIINGAMQVAQRGTSISPTGAAQGMHLDRFSAYGADGEMDYAQSTEAPSGFYYSVSVSPNTANASPAASDFRVTMRHKIEGYNASPTGWGTSNGKTCTLSFWMKTNKTGIHPWFVTNTTQTTTFQSFINVTNTDWNYYTKEIPAPSSSDAFNLGTNAVGIDIQFNFGGLGSTYTTISSTDSTMNTWTGASPKWGLSDGVNFDDSTSNQLYMTGFQFEVGDTATPFEHRSYGDELQRCKRYFERFNYADDKYTSIVCYNESTSHARGSCPFTVEKRAVPTMTATSSAWAAVSTGTTGTAQSIAADHLTTTNARVYITNSNSTLVDGGASHIRNIFNDDAHISFDAEL